MEILTSLATILQQYHEVSDIAEREATGMEDPKNSKSARSRENKNLLHRVQRYLAELNLDRLTVADLAQLVKEMETALVQTRATKVSINTQHMIEPIRILQEKEKMLREENKLLRQQIGAMAKEDIAPKDMENHREVELGLSNLGNNEMGQSPLRLLPW
ncbi:hypothetical protein POM88_008739 [Heracleum sosnowskyi]|uniref:K-box domain-containing protein n=1 Tax=Heracleum sosnowskyi TaxID=360622 RepID=A0AAD8JA19_9APIA|nr:hypothetical protein POM88_008739 [Heracleum sosnowskyi]